MPSNYQDIKKTVLAAFKAALKDTKTSAIEPYAEGRLVSWFVSYPKKVRPVTQRAMSNIIRDIGVIVVSEASATAHIGSIVRFNLTLPKELSFEEADELENALEEIAISWNS
jgi:hypothetical protein